LVAVTMSRIPQLAWQPSKQLSVATPQKLFSALPFPAAVNPFHVCFLSP